MAATSLFDKIFQQRKKKSTEFTSNSAVFEFDSIRDATNEFSCLVGRGGFGSVYKVVSLFSTVKQGESEAESTVICGTVGYVDPEYLRTARISIKSDVYAFGVTILTIISRRKALSLGYELLEQRRAIDVINESIGEILRYIHIALLCVNENAETRPSLDEVLHWFSCLSTPLPEPTIGNRFLAEEESIGPGHHVYLPLIALLRHPYLPVKEIEHDRIRLPLFNWLDQSL